MEESKCDNCKWWEQYALQTKGVCRGVPPTPVFFPTIGTQGNFSPETYSTDCCALHSSEK